MNPSEREECGAAYAGPILCLLNTQAFKGTLPYINVVGGGEIFFGPQEHSSRHYNSIEGGIL